MMRRDRHIDVEVRLLEEEGYRVGFLGDSNLNISLGAALSPPS